LFLGAAICMVNTPAYNVRAFAHFSRMDIAWSCRPEMTALVELWLYCDPIGAECSDHSYHGCRVCVPRRCVRWSRFGVAYGLGDIVIVFVFRAH
jgi:hypothetical protein